MNAWLMRLGLVVINASLVYGLWRVTFSSDAKLIPFSVRWIVGVFCTTALLSIHGILHFNLGAFDLEETIGP